MINNFKKKTANVLLFSVLSAVLLFVSCDTNLVETYDEYVPENVVSLATPDSVAAVATDYNKLLFRVFINSDPKIKKIVIALFDDDTTDGDDKILTTIDVNRTIFQPETYEIELDLPEAGTEYFVHLEDSNGKKSIKYDVFGTVVGDIYKESLEPRVYSEIKLYSDTEVSINWITNRALNDDNEEVVLNNLLVKTEITYLSSIDGTEQTIVVDESEDITIIPDFVSEGVFTYTTFYRLVEGSIYEFESNPIEGTFPTKL